MPFSNVTDARKRVPALDGLSTKQVRAFISTFNNLEAAGEEEGAAIPQAISAAQMIDKSMSNTKQIIKAVDDELMQSIEIVYEPYELDAQEQWMSPETISKACQNFNANLEKGNILPNMFHSKGEDGVYSKTENFSILKSWVNEVDCEVGGQPVKEGTWICKLQWSDPTAWELRKSGTYQGVSIGANGVIVKPKSEDS